MQCVPGDMFSASCSILVICTSTATRLRSWTTDSLTTLPWQHMYTQKHTYRQTNVKSQWHTVFGTITAH